MGHAQQLADRCAGACTVVAVAVVAGLGVDAGLVGHSGVRAGVGIPHRQVEQIGLANQRDLRNAHIKADAAFLKVAHHAACGVQPKGAAAAQQNGVDDLCCGRGLEQFTLPRSRPAAAHIKAHGGTGFAQQKHRTAGARLGVFGLADL